MHVLKNDDSDIFLSIFKPTIIHLLFTINCEVQFFYILVPSNASNQTEALENFAKEFANR